MVTAVISTVLILLAVLSLLIALYYAARALASRSKAGRMPYDVGRQEARRGALVQFVIAAVALAVGVVMLVAVAFIPRAGGPAMAPQATPTQLPTDTITVPVATQPPATATPNASPTPPMATNTPTPEPTPTATPEPPVARVNSPVGVWLRAAPGTDAEQLEWLLDGTELILLPGRETVEELEWQQVQTQAGVSGWVAAEFIVIE